jgi:hypothetical protein
MEVLQFRVLKGGFGRFAGFVLDLCAKFSLSTEGDSQKRRLFIWLFPTHRGSCAVSAKCCQLVLFQYAGFLSLRVRRRRRSGGAE